MAASLNEVRLSPLNSDLLEHSLNLRSNLLGRHDIANRAKRHEHALAKRTGSRLALVVENESERDATLRRHERCRPAMVRMH
jgi:hypothetical protein